MQKCNKNTIFFSLMSVEGKPNWYLIQPKGGEASLPGGYGGGAAANVGDVGGSVKKQADGKEDYLYDIWSLMYLIHLTWKKKDEQIYCFKLDKSRKNNL